MGKSKSKYVIILITALMIGICTNLAHPVTPYLIKERAWPEYAFSIFFALMSLGMLIFAPIWGVISDKYGRRLVILISSLGYSLGQVMFSCFTNLYLVFFARFFSGIFSSGLNVALVSYLSSSIGLKGFDKNKLIPSVLSLQLVGNSLGNFIGGALGKFVSYPQVLLIQAAVLSLFGIILYLFFNLKDDIDKNTVNKTFIDNFKNISKIGLFSIIFLLCLTGFSLVFTNAQRYLDYYYSDIGEDSYSLGSLNLVIGIVTLISNILITPFLLKRLKPIYSIILSGIIGSIALIITFSFKDQNTLFILIYSVFMIYIISKSIIESASVAFISNINSSKGLLLGVRQSFISLGAVIGPLLGGAIYFNLSLDFKFILFYICAILYLISAVALILLFIFKNKFKSKPEEV